MTGNEMFKRIGVGLMMVFIISLTMASAMAYNASEIDRERGSHFGFLPLTVFGQESGCSDYPSDTYNFEYGEEIHKSCDDCVYNLHARTSSGETIFIDEWVGRIDYTFNLYSEYWVDVYDGCSYSDEDITRCEGPDSSELEANLMETVERVSYDSKVQKERTDYCISDNVLGMYYCDGTEIKYYQQSLYDYPDYTCEDGEAVELGATDEKVACLLKTKSTTDEDAYIYTCTENLNYCPSHFVETFDTYSSDEMTSDGRTTMNLEECWTRADQLGSEYGTDAQQEIQDRQIPDRSFLRDLWTGNLLNRDGDGVARDYLNAGFIDSVDTVSDKTQHDWNDEVEQWNAEQSEYDAIMTTKHIMIGLVVGAFVVLLLIVILRNRK